MTPGLLQAFDRGRQLPDDRAELLLVRSVRRSEATSGEPTLSDDAQICNCNGVTKGETHLGGAGRLPDAQDALRRDARGHGLRLVQAAGAAGARRSSPATGSPTIRRRITTCPACRSTKPALVRRDPRPAACAASRRCSPRSAGGVEDPASKAGLASLLKTIWGAEYEDERDARFINDRVHANIQKDGTFSVVPRIYGGVTSPAELRRIADVAEKLRRADGQDHRRPADRSARHSEGEAAGRVARSRDAVRARLHEVVPHLQDLRRHRVLPLRRRRQHGARHRRSSSDSRASSRRTR